MKQHFLGLVYILIATTATAQTVVKKDGYEFTINRQAKCTPVKNQQKTGTCWCFSGVSFLESEVLRTANVEVDLSEMYGVRHTYAYKAERFVRYQGKVNFGEGGLAHDAINALATHGIVPETVYNGRKNNGAYDHSELVKNIEKQLKTALAAKPFDADYLKEINTTLNAEMGAPPTEFMYNSQPYTPLRFAQELGLDANNYVSLTSYTHHKFYAPFVLEVPDNFSHGAFYNLPLNELTGVVDAALAAGYTVAWDADVSNEGFNHKESLALLPAPDERKPFKKPCIEQAVTQATRQQAFDTQSVTDDHLMHIVGTATDQKGRQYYVIKNSWGDDSNETKGYLYCSKAYFEMNTVSVLLNKKAIGDGLRTKLGL